MDFLSLLTTSIPAYFVFSPLVIFFVILVVLIVKTKNTQPVVPVQVVAAATPTPTQMPASVAQQQASPLTSRPPAYTPAAPVQVQPQAEQSSQVPLQQQMPVQQTSQVSSSVPQSVAPSFKAAPVQSQGVIQQASVAQSQVPRTPLQQEAATPVSSAPVASPVATAPVSQTQPGFVSQGVIPPISAWRPVEPKEVPASPSVGKSEADLQAEAVTSLKKASAPVIPTENMTPASSVPVMSGIENTPVASAQTTSVGQDPLQPVTPQAASGAAA